MCMCVHVREHVCARVCLFVCVYLLCVLARVMEVGRGKPLC